MVAQRVKQSPAPAIPRLSLSANPKVGSSADIHEFSFIEGNVSIGSGTMVAPGTAVTAEQGASVLIGDRVKLLPGVLVEGIAGTQVMNANDASQAGKAYSIYIGASSVVAHKSIVRSPAFVGANCFIGFRSTLFNARLGDGCIVMMHTLIQDVEIPPGRCVPSGSIITSQHQADQLPKVRSEDLECAREVIGLGQSSSSRARYRNVSSNLSEQTSGQTSRYAAKNTSHQSNQFSTATEGAAMQAQRLSSEIVQQVRSYLAQGYRVGMEHADKRRYRSGVWETCTPIKDTREQAVFSALENCLAEHTGEYVRMFGIDPARKQRVGMVTVQRPGDAPVAKTASSGGSYGGQSYSSQSYSSQSYSGGGGASQSEGGLPAGVVQEVRNLLSGGYLIGTEHAGPRHYRSNVWKVCSPIDSRNEREVFSRLEHCLDEHSGEYVRMFGIDSGSNSRTATTTIQRADGRPIEVDPRPVANASSQAQGNGNGYAQPSQSYAQSGGNAGGEVAQAVGRIIRSGNHVGVEFADKRRYRSGIWQTAPSINASSESAAVNQLQRFLDQNADKYVRIFGVNIQTKTRGAATTIHKPGQKSGQNGAQSGSQSDSSRGVSTSGRRAARGPINANPPHYDDPAYLNHSNGGGIDATVMDQVTQLINQGHKISIEYADKRRYRSGIWKTGPAIDARRPAEAISALGKQLAQHNNDYVRLVGVDPNVKRRVVELTIQRPGQQAVQSGGRNNRSSFRGVTSTGRDPINSNPPHYDDPAFRGQPSSYGQSGGYNSNGQSSGYNSHSSGGLESNVMDQVTQLINQGHRISVEYADKRRYRSGIWKTGEAIDARRPAEAISALGKQLARHQGEYVRLVGIDPQAKRRVLEATIQRP
ncbi:ribulose bisphosphate carboxylase, small subunit, putative [Synechococcus sp. PCC 7335]|uniref:ribulose bisphosphate carboxylase small subunit n=1 Tax=Synechococcus sp. (strain ATCC 29403 / PCC 7335) TaxID=91464 RepID=UPI00017EB126|nr:ribulose bisphosphate carboxylase small subunit [Synechococcus sp. PCC 7335]EDX86709.1 ribulose bisphosphate carboxylase, small subunit, putative [Synechococcus sp. PCC 7335]